MKYGAPEGKTVDDERVTIRQALPRTRSKLVYMYDFGDCWRHDVVVEKVVPADASTRYPRCTAGKRPPEDCGGPWGYEEKLESVRDPSDDEHEDVAQWLGPNFDPEAFDVDALNAALASI